MRNRPANLELPVGLRLLRFATQHPWFHVTFLRLFGDVYAPAYTRGMRAKETDSVPSLSSASHRPTAWLSSHLISAGIA